MSRMAEKNPRRRAKQKRSLETVEVVLEAAAQVLLREGYARATTNRIAERAGVSVGTIYQYFGGKDEVFDALIQRYFADVLAKIRASPPDPSSLPEVSAQSVGEPTRLDRVVVAPLNRAVRAPAP